MSLRAVLAVLAAALTACARPVSDEAFVQTSQRQNGFYEFSMDLGDTAQTYTLSLLLDFGAGNHEFASFRNLPVFAGWRSPSDRTYQEEVWIGRDDLSSASYFDKVFMVPYRTGVSVKEAGIWRLSLAVPEDSVARYSLKGIGLRLTREKKN